MAGALQGLRSRGQPILAREPRGQAVGAREDTIAPDLYTLGRISFADETQGGRTLRRRQFGH